MALIDEIKKTRDSSDKRTDLQKQKMKIHPNTIPKISSVTLGEPGKDLNHLSPETEKSGWVRT